MISKLWMTGVAAAVVAVLIGGSSFAAASGRSGEDVDLRLLEIRTAVVPVDVPPSGPSAGDEVLLSGRLRNLANTRTVGRTQDECTLISATSGALHCETTVTLAGGTLEASGIANGGPTRSRCWAERAPTTKLTDNSPARPVRTERRS